MDNLRGAFDSTEPADDTQDWDAANEQDARDVPPDSIGQDERRMQVRAYNHWASLLGERNFPAIDSLETDNLPDFGPYSVVLDFSAGIDDPAVQFLGGSLAEECGAEGHISQLSDVPPRSLLSRITDHYMQILANQAPIGFEAEFVNQRGIAILYRGILLPFSSNDDTIDFIYGVINWKEMADQVTADELLLEIDQALETDETVDAEADEPQKHPADPVTEWADSPASEMGESDSIADNTFELTAEAEENEESEDSDAPLDLGEYASIASIGAPSGDAGHGPVADEDETDDLPMPNFGDYALDDPEDEDEEEDASGSYDFASLTDYIEAPTKKAKALEMDPEELESENAELGSGDYNPANYNPGAYGADTLGTDTNSSGEYDAGNDDVADFGEAEDHAVADTYGDGAEADLPPINPVPDAPVLSEPVQDEPAPTADEPVAEEPAMDTFTDAQPEAEPTPIAELAEPLPDDAGLYDCLASARELAQTANTSEDRSRQALYAAVGRAYDFSLAAKDAPEDYDELIAESGLSVQERAPMTPVVKLVFGSDYDKTRLTEYATVLTHAHRVGLERGSLAGFLREAEGGLKGVVSTERRLRREESGKPVVDAREALAQKLRELEAIMFDAIEDDGPEFGLVMIRRDEHAGVEVLGEIEPDLALIERAARKLVG